MAPKISAITPASRGVKELTNLLNDFRNQTFRDFEHIIVYDGKPPADVVALMAKAGPWTRFVHIEKDLGDMKTSPGTNPRNHGIRLAQGEYVVFCDDDDRYKDTYLEKLIGGMVEKDMISVVQMSCQESRMYKNGNPEKSTLVPEIGLPTFPMMCHIGTPCFMVRRDWAVADPWRHEPEHDFRFLLRICQKHKPKVNLISGLQVDVDSQIIKGMKDWVSIPPFFRNNP